MSVDKDIVERVRLERHARHVPVKIASMWLQRGATLASHLMILRSAIKTNPQGQLNKQSSRIAPTRELKGR